MQNNFPLNWCECKLETVCALDNGLKQNDLNLPLLDAKYLRGKKEAEYRRDGVVLNPKDYVILVDGENSGEIFSIHQIGIMGSTFKKLNFSDSCSVPYVLFFIKSKQDLFRTNKKGAAIPHLDKTLFKNLQLPLPPLAEQERIVEKIEALFAGIDEGVERLKSAQVQIKQYRQSVLKSAFEGKLYKTTEWKEVQLKDVCEKITDGSHFSPKQVSNGCYPYITVKDVRKDIIDFDAAKRIDKKQYELLLKSGCKPYKGDVLFSKDGTVGKVVLVDYEKEFVILSSLAILRPKKELKSEFLFYVLKSPKFLAEAINKKTGIAIRRIILDTLKRISISFPSDISVQQRIVEEIEKRFAVADKLEKAVNEGLEKADKLKQSILKKAFSGQLVPQDPNDEPASIILERIKKEKHTQSKGLKK